MLQRQPAEFWKLFQRTATCWLQYNMSQMGAALAFYTVFSIAPVLVISLRLVGWVLGPEAAQLRIDIQLKDYVGAASAQAIDSMVVAASRPKAGLMATTWSCVALLIGTFAMFSQLQDALNSIWEVKAPAKQTVRALVMERLPAFLMVFVVSALILLLVIGTGALTTLSQAASGQFPAAMAIAHIGNMIGSFLIVTLLVAVIFKVLPEVRIAWSDVWIGAMMTSLLFTLGKYGISYYLTTAAIDSAYGAAGSVAVILLWTYYSSQIVFFGAVMTRVYAKHYGSHTARTASSPLPETQ